MHGLCVCVGGGGGSRAQGFTAGLRVQVCVGESRAQVCRAGESRVWGFRAWGGGGAGGQVA